MAFKLNNLFSINPLLIFIILFFDVNLIYIKKFSYECFLIFSFDYVDKNRKMLNDSWTLDLFLANFDKNNSVFESYLSKISDISSLSIDTKEKINSYVKATIAREIFGDEGFYRSIQKDDAMLQKVLELDSSTE